MGSLSIWHWMIVLVVVLLLFGRGKLSELMGDAAKGNWRSSARPSSFIATPPISPPRDSSAR